MENKLTRELYAEYIGRIKSREQGAARIIFASLLSSVTAKSYEKTESDILLLPFSPIVLSDAEQKALDEKVSAFCDGNVPYQYLTGFCEFYGRSFEVNEDVLIPRVDTEVVVERAVAECKKGSLVLDLCCGSGCIGITVAAETGASVVLADFSEKALAVAAKNAKNAGVSSLCKTVVHDVKKDAFCEKFDVMVSNPPYIPVGDIDGLSPYVLREPRAALDGGADGLDFYRIITEKYRENLNCGGALVFECGIGQADDVRHILEENSFCDVSFEKDGGGIERTVWGYKK